MKNKANYFFPVLLFLLFQSTWLCGQVVERQVIGSLGVEIPEMSATLGDLVISRTVDSLTNGFQQPVIAQSTGSIVHKRMSNLRIVPNPNQGSFRLSSEEAGVKKFMLYAMNGQLLYELELYGEEQIHVDLPPGTYACVVYAGSTITTDRIVIIP